MRRKFVVSFLIASGCGAQGAAVRSACAAG